MSGATQENILPANIYFFLEDQRSEHIPSKYNIVIFGSFDIMVNNDKMFRLFIFLNIILYQWLIYAVARSTSSQVSHNKTTK